MLLELYIENFGIIDRLRLSFHPGLNVLTGETGAGKSMVIDAVEVVVGARASSDLVRTGAERALVEATFDLKDSERAARLLEEQGIEGPGSKLVLSRELARGGRNSSRLNGRAVSAGLLRLLSQQLLDLHGQHEHQSLLDPQNHLEVLDHFAGAEPLGLRAEVSALYADWKRLTRERAELLGDQRDRVRRLDLLRFQVHEIDAAKLEPGEETELEQKRLVLDNAEKLFSVAASAFAGLYEGQGDRSPPALDTIRSSAAALADAARIDPSLQPWAQALEEAGYQVEEVARGLARYREAVPFDPALRAQVDQRLDLINGLKRKYGDTLVEILAYRNQAAAEMERLERSDELAAALDARISEVLVKLGRAAAELSRRRQAAAEALGSRVEGEIGPLGMESARFQVDLAQEEDPNGLEVEGKRLAMGASGVDRVEFLFTANPGEPPRPLVRIASGGELARVMLAIKSVLAEADAIPTMIFDEVDAGIGGRTVLAVADRLFQVGRRHQVLCVTHLPQIACLADAHIAVAKEVSDGRTRALARRLKDAERLDELARMLGGADLTGVTVDHARELLERGQKRRSEAAAR